MSSNFKGFIYGILAAASYGMNPAFALPLYEEGMSTTSVLCLRYAFALPILAIMMAVRGQSLKISLRKELLPIAVLGLLMGFSSLGLFLSYRYMPAGIASTILFVYPLMVAVIMAIVFKQKISQKTWICLAVAMGGISLLTVNGEWGGAGKYDYFTGIFWVIMSSLSYAIYIVGVNTERIKKVPTLRLTFYVLFFGWFIFLAQIVFGEELILPDSAGTWICTVALALIPTALSLIFTSLAIQNIGSTPTAILGVFEPVTAIFFGVILFGETLYGEDIAGIILIMSAVTMVIAGNRIHVPLNRIRKLFPKTRN